MSFTPQQARAMSLWDYLAARAGWVRANCPEDAGKDLSAEQMDRLGALLDATPPWEK